MQVQWGSGITKRIHRIAAVLYRALRSLNPSPYMYYYHFGDFHVWALHRRSWCARKTPEGQK